MSLTVDLDRARRFVRQTAPDVDVVLVGVTGIVVRVDDDGVGLAPELRRPRDRHGAGAAKRFFETASV